MSAGQEKLNLRVREREGGIRVLDVGGILDRHTNMGLERLLAQLFEDGVRRLVINFDELRYISSDGISLLISYLMRFRREDGDIKFYNLRSEGKTVLTVLGLGDLFQNYADEDSAVSAFTRPVKEGSTSNRLYVSDREESGVTVMSLDGFVDRHTIDGLEETMEAKVASGKHKLVISCGGMSYICSSGLGLFIQHLPRLRNRGGDIRFCCLQNQARTLMNVLGLASMFDIFETEQEAIASFSQPA